MRLSAEQKRSIIYPDHCMINACPGSGKTRTIISKLLNCLDDVRSTSRRIACITYTNTAADEIDSRLRKQAFCDDELYWEISTIHTFCLNNIMRNFYWKTNDFKNGFSVLPTESSEFQDIVDSLIEKYNLEQKNRQDFELLRRNIEGNPVWKISNKKVAFEFWEMLRKKRYLDFTNILYYSYLLLRENEFISHYISSKYDWILIDEFQDTTAIQVEIFKIISKYQKVKFFLVGDPCQSIYSFAGANPRLMNEFSSFLGAKNDLEICTNYRSSNHIVNFADSLLSRNNKMIADGEDKDFLFQPRYYHVESTFIGITDYFVPAIDEQLDGYGNAAILSPQWFTLLPLGRQLREYGIPVVGPGARPYKMSRLFAQFAENICSYISEPNPDKLVHIERHLFFLILNITSKSDFRIHSYFGRRVVYRMIRKGTEIFNTHQNARNWLIESSNAFSTILIEEDILPKSLRNVLSDSVNEILNDMEKNRIDFNNYTVSELGVFANPRNCLKLLTIHGAKGREFDAVALIDLHEGKIPHWSSNENSDLIEESKRLFYVGITRAKKIIMLFTDYSKHENRPTRFLDGFF